MDPLITPAAAELLDALMGHWALWNVHERFYLETLAPKLAQSPSEGDEVERRLLARLREELGDGLVALPQLLRERRQYNLTQRQREAEAAAKKREAEAEARALWEQQQREAAAALAEQERQKQIAATARSARRREALARLNACLEDDFLRADRLRADEYEDVIDQAELRDCKTEFVKRWFKARPHLDQPDSEQAAAIGETGLNVQVVARAGSGKTRTLVNRAIFLQVHCHVPPSEILLLAFNRRAAGEITDRLSHVLKGSVPQAMTFHALAYGIVHPTQQLLYNQDDNRVLDLEVQRIIDDHLRIPGFGEDIRRLMMAHFREDWSQILEGGYHLIRDDFLRYRRSLPKLTLRGEYVKSWGEKLIADFLFENAIPYSYERNHWWRERNYRPDFTLTTGPNAGLVVEYFGMAGNPDYDELAEKKRQYWAGRTGWALVEMGQGDLPSQAAHFQQQLANKLAAKGVTGKRLTEDEIWEQVKDRAVGRFSTAMGQFVLRCRKAALNSAQLSDAIRRHKPVSVIEADFLTIAERVYEGYLRRLEEGGLEDFDGLMERATRAIGEGSTRWHRASGTGDLAKLRYVLIDEHQDFSAPFDRFLGSIRARNPGLQVFCVGDDWQAINRFAGSDLKFFERFPQDYPPASRLGLRKNYRSGSKIIRIGNAIMEGQGQPAVPVGERTGAVLRADLRKLVPTPVEYHLFPEDSLTPAIVRLVAKAAAGGKRVVLLARKDGVPWYVARTPRPIRGTTGPTAQLEDSDTAPRGQAHGAMNLEAFTKLLKNRLPKEWHALISTSTVHRFKGREEDWVVILDAVDRSYPLIHPDWVFCRLFGDTIEKLIEEERRLFHVAVTRARETLILVTEADNISPFLETGLVNDGVSELHWKEFPPPPLRPARIVIEVGNQPDSRGTLAIREALQAEGFRWVSAGWECWAKSYPAERFLLRGFIETATWASQATGIEVRLCEDAGAVLRRYAINQGQWAEIAG